MALGQSFDEAIKSWHPSVSKKQSLVKKILKKDLEDLDWVLSGVAGSVYILQDLQAFSNNVPLANVANMINLPWELLSLIVQYKYFKEGHRAQKEVERRGSHDGTRPPENTSLILLFIQRLWEHAVTDLTQGGALRYRGAKSVCRILTLINNLQSHATTVMSIVSGPGLQIVYGSAATAFTAAGGYSLVAALWFATFTSAAAAYRSIRRANSISYIIDDGIAKIQNIDEKLEEKYATLQAKGLSVISNFSALAKKDRPEALLNAISQNQSLSSSKGVRKIVAEIKTLEEKRKKISLETGQLLKLKEKKLAAGIDQQIERKYYTLQMAGLDVINGFEAMPKENRAEQLLAAVNANQIISAKEDVQKIVAELKELHAKRKAQKFESRLDEFTATNPDFNIATVTNTKLAEALMENEKEKAVQKTISFFALATMAAGATLMVLAPIAPPLVLIGAVLFTAGAAIKLIELAGNARLNSAAKEESVAFIKQKLLDNFSEKKLAEARVNGQFSNVEDFKKDLAFKLHLSQLKQKNPGLGDTELRTKFNVQFASLELSKRDELLQQAFQYDLAFKLYLPKLKEKHQEVLDDEIHRANFYRDLQSLALSDQQKILERAFHFDLAFKLSLPQLKQKNVGIEDEVLRENFYTQLHATPRGKREEILKQAFKTTINNYVLEEALGSNYKALDISEPDKKAIIKRYHRKYAEKIANAESSKTALLFTTGVANVYRPPPSHFIKLTQSPGLESHA